MKRSIAFAGALAVALGTICAQGGDNPLERQVDVTRDYRPTVERAAKLPVQPNMTDTVQLRPEFDYTVKPTPINHGFGITTLSPVSIDVSTYEPLYPFYAKVGFGFPGQSLADLYVNSTGRGKGSVGLYLNHTGNYNKIKNDLGFKNKATTTENSAGLTGRVRFGKVMLSGEAGLDYDMFSRYGQFNYGGMNVEGKGKVQEQKFMTPRASLRVGNDFKDLSYLNFAVTAGGYYFEDDFSVSESGAAFGLELAKQYGDNQLSLSLGYDGAYGNDMLNDYKNHIINVAPRYNFVSDRVKMGLGINFVFDKDDDDTDMIALPAFNIAMISTPQFVPYIDIDGRVERSSYRSLTSRNPYLSEYSPIPDNTYHYDARAGVQGAISGVFMYRLYGGFSYVKDAVNFANVYSLGNSSTFYAFREKRMLRYTAALELEGRFASSFSMAIAGRYHGYDTKTFEHESGLPEYEVSLKLKWNHRDKFFVTGGFDIIGSRWFMEYRMESDVFTPEFSYVKQKSVFDVNLELEYRIQKTLGIFLSGNNLAGSKLYRFNHYPSNGPMVSLGAKFMF